MLQENITRSKMEKTGATISLPVLGRPLTLTDSQIKEKKETKEHAVSFILHMFLCVDLCG